MTTLLAGNSRSFLVVVLGCTVGVLSFVVGAARNSKSLANNLSSHANKGHVGSSGDGDSFTRPCTRKVRPTAIATWRFGEIAVAAAKGLLEDGASALDALEAGTTIGQRYH